MTLNPTMRLARQLAEAVNARQALIATGAKLTDFLVMQADKRAGVLAAELAAALDAPQTFTPWTPAHPRNACPDYKPGAAS